MNRIEGTSLSLDAALKRSASTAVRRVLSQADTDGVDAFWKDDSVRRLMSNDRSMSASQRGALRELAMSTASPMDVKRYLKRMKGRTTRHGLWMQQVNYDGRSVCFADALGMLVDSLAGPRFEERRVAVESAVSEAFASAGSKVTGVDYDVEQARAQSLGASLSYLIRRAQAEAGAGRGAR